MNELLSVLYQCAYCGETNEAMVDPTGGNNQVYTEDCSICCRPNTLHVTVQSDGTATLEVEYEG